MHKDAMTPLGSSENLDLKDVREEKRFGMTLNITVASPRFVICATDRRLINLDTHKISTEQSTKLTLLQCQDALAMIAYNGIGLFQNKTPADWILELDNKVGLASLPFKDVLEELRVETEKRIEGIPKHYDRRHTFVIGAWGRGHTWICVVSNYEEAHTDKIEEKARDNFVVSALPQQPRREVRVLVTGATDDVDSQDCISIARVAKKSGAAGVDIRNLCVKAIRHAAYSRKGRGAIGSSVLWAVAERYKGVECGLDVLGGTTVHAMPNMIVPGKQMKEIRIEAPRGKSVIWGKPFPLPEGRCPKCGNPVPLGYQRCSVCGNKM